MVRNRKWIIKRKLLVVNSFQIIIFADGSQRILMNMYNSKVVNSFQIIIFADGSQHPHPTSHQSNVVNSFQIIIFADGSQQSYATAKLIQGCE